MWELINDMMPRRKRGINTVTALVVGAGVGIAAWEMMRRNNVAGESSDDMGRIAESMMDAIDMD
ncbi:hypothetical protein [Tumebacillus permanentifrigoris]|uniref:Uncharacterized protein n=1 Tax=Tumebacillus permanentifrigoris TaxID=378543 RepID=A0A316D997_9BACL|nr:hypothetical protein [Tumebacillus permanentifrigoris]PWK13745.1 hypothetical protein C7459_10623 [Tumebacillus permanentifrigoris]